MKQPHKHAELIKAWADGAEIEYWNQYQKQWKTASKPNWDENNEYRIKPEPKPDVVLYSIAHPLTTNNLGNVSNAYPLPEKWEPNLRLTFDGETGKLKKAEVLE